MNVLALDPAKLTGFCHSNGLRGVFDLGEEKYRLFRFYDFVLDTFRKHPFEVLATEDAQKGSNNWHTAAQHAELRAILKLLAGQLMVDFILVHPTSLKAWAAHSGRAKKADMKRWAGIHYGVTIEDENECDAFLIMQYVLAGQHLKVIPAKAVRKREKVRRKKEARLF